MTRKEKAIDFFEKYLPIDHLVVVLGLLITTMLLTSCQNGQSLGMISQKKNEVTIDHAQKEPMDTFESDIDFNVCPNCEGGCLYFYRLAIGDGELIVCCEECSAIWLDPDNLVWGAAVSDQVLGERFQVEDAQILFGEGSDWATADDVRNSIWNSKKSESLIKN